MGDDSTLDNFFIGIMGSGAVAAFALFGYEVYEYLRFGEWPGYSAITALRLADVEWATAPREWLGVYKILDAFPLPLAILVSGVLPFGLLSLLNKT